MLLPYFETVNLLEFASLSCCVFTLFRLKTFIITESCHSFCNFSYMYNLECLTLCKVHEQLYGDEYVNTDS